MLWLSRSIRESKKVSLNSVIPSHMRSVAMAFIIAHRGCSSEGTRKISQNQGSELSGTTMVPQHGAVADITRRNDQLYLIPGNAVGTTAPKGIPVCYWSTRQTRRLSKNRGVLCTEKAVLKN